MSLQGWCTSYRCTSSFVLYPLRCLIWSFKILNSWWVWSDKCSTSSMFLSLDSNSFKIDNFLTAVSFWFLFAYAMIVWTSDSSWKILLLQEETASTHASHLQKHEITDYASMMGIIVSMVKQDYEMQVIWSENDTVHSSTMVLLVNIILFYFSIWILEHCNDIVAGKNCFFSES